MDALVLRRVQKELHFTSDNMIVYDLKQIFTQKTGHSRRYGPEVTSPLLRLNEEGKLVGRHLSIFGSTDRLRRVLHFRHGCRGEECSRETELGVDFCLTWSTDPR